MYNIRSSANMDKITFSFSICIQLISFTCFIALSIKNYCGQWAASLIPDFLGIALSFSPLRIMLAKGL